MSIPVMANGGFEEVTIVFRDDEKHVITGNLSSQTFDNIYFLYNKDAGLRYTYPLDGIYQVIEAQKKKE